MSRFPKQVLLILVEPESNAGMYLAEQTNREGKPVVERARRESQQAPASVSAQWPGPTRLPHYVFAGFACRSQYQVALAF